MHGSAQRETFKTIQVWKAEMHTRRAVWVSWVRSAVSQNLGRDTHLERKDMGARSNEEERSKSEVRDAHPERSAGVLSEEEHSKEMI